MEGIEGPNYPNVLFGAMVAGPSYDDMFIDWRDQPKHTEPAIAGNTGLVAALAALRDEQAQWQNRPRWDIEKDFLDTILTLLSSTSNVMYDTMFVFNTYLPNLH